MYRATITNGIRFLRRVQNEDMGIPATLPGAVSGCWTSGETLETILLSPFQDKSISPFASDLILHLERSQIGTGKEKGGWPLVIGGKRASTMATGHNIASLILAQNYFDSDSLQKSKIQALINDGFTWLEKNQNVDGGWGVEPNGGADGSISRMISTFYALRAYFALSKTVDTSKIVRDGIKWILTLKNKDNGFGGRNGYESDPCNTARAVSALLQSQQYSSKDSVIKKAMGYISSSKPFRNLWHLDTEVYVTDGAPGQTVYNSNTTADVLEAYLRTNQYNKNVRDLIGWFLENQQDDGSWYLGANTSLVRDIKTWSTNEALYVLSMASKVISDQYFPILERRIAALTRVAFGLILIVIFQFGFIVKVPENILMLWEKIPENTRSILVQGIFLALAINLLSSFLYDKIPSWRAKKETKNG